MIYFAYWRYWWASCHSSSASGPRTSGTKHRQLFNKVHNTSLGRQADGHVVERHCKPEPKGMFHASVETNSVKGERQEQPDKGASPTTLQIHKRLEPVIIIQILFCHENVNLIHL